MPFASRSDFDKWHKSIQCRLNASSAGRKQTGATLPPFRCDITTGPRQPREKSRGDAPSPRQWGAAKDQRKGRGMNSNACEVGLSKQTRDAAIPRLSQTKAQRGTTSDMPSKSGSIPPEPTPYPPVRYEWEAEE